MNVTNPSSTAQAIAWDPTSPFSLSICPNTTGTVSEATKENEESKESPLHILLSHDGAGIHPVETTCLISLLDARDSWLESNSKDVKELSIEYRRCLCECLIDLKPKGIEGDDDGEITPQHVNNYESLALIYAMMHLNEIYLLPSISSKGVSTEKLDGPAGSLTADTVRYLRLNHLGYDLETDAVTELLKMDQPEYYIPEKPSNDPFLEGPFSQPYYNLLYHLFNLGQLSSAWAVLTRHSSCRRAEEEATRGGTSMSKEGDAWSALRAVLLSAPLPAGRGEDDDAGLADDDDITDINEVDVDPNFNVRLIEGIPRSAPCLWEVNPNAANTKRNERYHRQCVQIGLDPPLEDVDILPIDYSEAVAMNIFTHWQREAKTLLKSGRMGNSVLSPLFTRFPQLEQIYSVILGRPPVGGASWPEMLVSELIYSRPNIAPADIVIRARVAMRISGVENEGQENLILKVMEGSAADVVSGVYSFGGGSGAALPATLTSLLSNLLIDTLPLQTEIVLSAAEAIVSSFSIQGQSDVGVRTSIRLLIPHAPPKRVGDEICYEPRIAAFISEIISHRKPESDAEVNCLLDILEETIRQGSARIADASESLVFCRACHHASTGNIPKQIFWLLRGIEIMSVWLPEDYRRSIGFACSRHFNVMCEESADELLSCLSAVQRADQEDQEKLKLLVEKAVPVLNRASSILEAVLKDDTMASTLRSNVEVALLYHIVNIATHQAENDNDQMAVHIIHCLEEQSSGGAVVTLANSSMYFRLLEIAVAILMAEDIVFESESTQKSTCCAFSVHGVYVLMARMNQVLFWEGGASSRIEYLTAMRMILCKGLMRSFVSDSERDTEKDKTYQIAKEMSLDEEVAELLDPSV